jgi:hypothetical protein
VPSCSIGFWVASTKKGSGSSWRLPPAETWRSTIDSSSAAWVLGGVRLISSASTTLAKIGPGAKRKVRSEVSGSIWSRSVPVMSEGIRSGVNWILAKPRCRVLARLEIISVLARPGTPSSRQWPRQRIAISS